jgi:hypothetical protein
MARRPLVYDAQDDSMRNGVDMKSSNQCLATMDEKQLRAWVKSPDRTPDELSKLVDQAVAIDRVIASHPNANATLLSALSHSRDRSTRARVAGNPTTPATDLIRLANEFPQKFLDNPASFSMRALARWIPKRWTLPLVSSRTFSSQARWWGSFPA